MDTVVTEAPPEVRAKMPVPEVDDRLTVSAPGSGLPKASCSWIVMMPSVGLAVAVPVTGDVVKTILAGGAVVME